MTSIELAMESAAARNRASPPARFAAKFPTSAPMSITGHLPCPCRMISATSTALGIQTAAIRVSSRVRATPK